MTTTRAALTKAEALQAEKWFRQHGLISMMRGTGYAASTARLAAPVLTLLFLVMMVLTALASPDLEIWQGILVALVSILATWLISNRVNRVPRFAPVKRIGAGEALAFVLVPTFLAASVPQTVDIDVDLIFTGAEGRLAAALITAAVQALLLALVWVFIMTGIGSLASLLVRQLNRALADTTTALAAVIPVLLGFTFFFFLNPGVWLAISSLDSLSFIGLVGFLVLLAGLFLGSRGQFQVDPLAEFADVDEVRSALGETDFAADADAVPAPTTTPLDWRQEANLRFVAVVSRLVTATVLAVVVFFVFVILGFIAVGTVPIETWTKQQPEILFSWTVGGQAHFVAWQHLKVAGFLAAFSGFNYALVSATDARLRQNAFDAATSIVRRACALRAVLLARSNRSAD